MNRELEEAIKNGHEPGHIFNHLICFCKKCNAILTFEAREEVRGLSGGKCSEQ